MKPPSLESKRCTAKDKYRLYPRYRNVPKMLPAYANNGARKGAKDKYQKALKPENALVQLQADLVSTGRLNVYLRRYADGWSSLHYAGDHGDHCAAHFSRVLSVQTCQVRAVTICITSGLQRCGHCVSLGAHQRKWNPPHSPPRLCLSTVPEAAKRQRQRHASYLERST